MRQVMRARRLWVVRSRRRRRSKWMIVYVFYFNMHILVIFLFFSFLGCSGFTIKKLDWEIAGRTQEVHFFLLRLFFTFSYFFQLYFSSLDFFVSGSVFHAHWGKWFPGFGMGRLFPWIVERCEGDVEKIDREIHNVLVEIAGYSGVEKGLPRVVI